MYSKAFAVHFILMLLASGLFSPVAAQMTTCTFSQYDMTIESNQQGNGSDVCTFSGSQGDSVTIDCRGCISLEVYSPSGQRFTTQVNIFSATGEIDIVLPETGIYEIHYSWAFGSRQDYIIDGDTGFGEIYTIYNEGFIFIGLRLNAAGSLPAVSVVDVRDIPLDEIEPLPPDTVVFAARDPETEYYNLFRVGINTGETPVQITGSDFYAHEPDISPDGRLIVFVRGVDVDNSDLWVVSVDGHYLAQLTSWPGLDRRPNWSPDGQEVLYQEQPIGDDLTYLSIVSLDSPLDVVPLTIYTGSHNPTWSPDGSMFAYSGFNENTSGYDLFIRSNFDDSVIDVIEIPGSGEYRPEWSPDGRWLAFNQSWGDDDEFSNISVLEVTTGEIITLVEAAPPFYNAAPKWSPDSSTILFRTYDETSDKFSVMAINLSGDFIPEIIELFAPFHIDSVSWY